VRNQETFLVLHHVESLDPLLDHPVGIRDVLAHPIDQLLRFVALGRQFLDLRVALLQFGLKLGDAVGGFHRCPVCVHMIGLSLHRTH